MDGKRDGKRKEAKGKWMRREDGKDKKMKWKRKVKGKEEETDE